MKSPIPSARAALAAPVLAASALAAAFPARAEAPHCMSRALADVPAMEAPEQVRSKSNGTFGPITQVKVDKASGRMFFCGANTYCYDSNAFEMDTPCRFKLDKAYASGRFFVYFTR